MTLTPQITLTISLEDFSGNQIGTIGQPAYVRVQLCNFGPFLPRIPGTAMIGQVADVNQEIPYVGSAITLKLWGNDVITPPETYYAISILDAKRNVIQTAPYAFTGTFSGDLSTVTPAPS